MEVLKVTSEESQKNCTNLFTIQVGFRNVKFLQNLSGTVLRNLEAQGGRRKAQIAQKIMLQGDPAKKGEKDARELRETMTRNVQAEISTRVDLKLN